MRVSDRSSPLRGEHVPMDQAMDSASKSPARWLLVCLGLAVSITETGCAKLRSYAQATPVMLGAAAPFQKTRAMQPPGGDLYGREAGKGVSESRQLLARERAEGKARDGNGKPRPDALMARSRPNSDELPGPTSTPVEALTGVSLQPPVTITQRQAAVPSS